jgi:hypothetical protein
MPNHHSNFPTDLTHAEDADGWRLALTRLPLQPEDTEIAVLPLSPSARLVKATRLPLFEGDATIGYLLEVYCVEEHFMRGGRAKPGWNLVWNGPSSTVELARRRYEKEPLDPNLKILPPPNA